MSFSRHPTLVVVHYTVQKCEDFLVNSQQSVGKEGFGIGMMRF